MRFRRYPIYLYLRPNRALTRSTELRLLPGKQRLSDKHTTVLFFYHYHDSLLNEVSLDLFGWDNYVKILSEVNRASILCNVI